jgi:dipeptidyl aminopeptidase/acylaminoacyl peptidase
MTTAPLVFRTLIASLALAGCSFAAPQNAADKIDRMLTNLEAVHHFYGVSISPDGKWVTWTEQTSGGYQLFLQARGSAMPPMRVTAGDGKTVFHEDGLAWSPDSTRFAFLSNAVAGQQQIFVSDAKGVGKPNQVTQLKGDVADLRWSPDGKTIAFLLTEGGATGGPLAAVPEQTGVIGSDFHNQRLAEVSAAGGELRRITSADINIYEYSWSPDGARLAAVAAPGPADNNWWVAKLYTVDRASGKVALTYQPPVRQQISVPRWSPDGSQIAFIGGIMSDEGFLGGDIYSVASAGGEARDLTPRSKLSASGIRWLTNGKILFSASLDGGGALAHLDVAGGGTELVWKGDQALHEDGNYPNFSLASDGITSAAVVSTWDHAPEVWTGKIGEWTQTTHANDKAEHYWGNAESVVWNSDGMRVQGWLLYPENFDAGKRYPMIVSIHGGPASEHSAGFPSVHFDMSVMAGLGYFVFFPNPRGSYGEGEAFTAANVKDFGGGDLRDVLAGLDAVEKKVPVDEARIGITGWSYGGYMTMWTVTQTNRFHAAVAGAGIANWQSYYGENSIDEWMIPYFGASVYDDPAVYAKSSPITFIKNVKTPTLVVVGERDGECPAPQSFEFWHALKTLGVKTELVVYAGEGHALRQPKNRLDVLKRTLNWFDENLR